MSQNDVRIMAHQHFPSFLRQKKEVDILDIWHRGEQKEVIYQPHDVTTEYTELMEKAPTPWLSLIVTAVVQNAELMGVRRAGSSDNMRCWETWQRNRMDGKQAALYRASCAHGLAFGVGMPGVDPLTNAPMTVMSIVSARKMAAFYDDDGEDEFPRLAVRAEPLLGDMGLQVGWTTRWVDESAVHFLSCKHDGEELSDWTYISYQLHGSAVTPVVRYGAQLDIDGRANSDIKPLIPLAARIDQDTFDRLIVQRFGAWKVRYIAGLARPSGAQDAQAQKMMLRIEDLLIAEDHDTKFGTLDATDLAGFISARDSDLRDMSATSQTPPHHMLGLSSNLQAESLAAAEAGLQRKSRERRTSWGESHESFFRLDAHLRGDIAEATAFDMQVRWRDTESRSMEQAALALGMLATNLKVPVEILWERIPGWTDADVERAKNLVATGGIDTLLAELETQLKTNPPVPVPVPVGG